MVTCGLAGMRIARGRRALIPTKTNPARMSRQHQAAICFLVQQLREAQEVGEARTVTAPYDVPDYSIKAGDRVLLDPGRDGPIILARELDDVASRRLWAAARYLGRIETRPGGGRGPDSPRLVG